MSLDCSKTGPWEGQHAIQHALLGYQLVPHVCFPTAPFLFFCPYTNSLMLLSIHAAKLVALAMMRLQVRMVGRGHAKEDGSSLSLDLSNEHEILGLCNGCSISRTLYTATVTA